MGKLSEAVEIIKPILHIKKSNLEYYTFDYLDGLFDWERIEQFLATLDNDEGCDNSCSSKSVKKCNWVYCPICGKIIVRKGEGDG